MLGLARSTAYYTLRGESAENLKLMRRLDELYTRRPRLKKASSMADTPKVRFESKMLIDGKLVDGEAGTFKNINPATEDVLGEVADASKADMHRAIDAARRAFDQTDWSTNRAFRKRCLEQLQTALEAEREDLREELILEAGCPRLLTHGPQLDAPLADALTYPAKLIDEYPWDNDLGDTFVALTGVMTTRKVWREPVGVVGAIVPWNFPFEVSIHKLGQALATGNTVVLKPAPDTPFNATRLGRLIVESTDIPPGVVNVVTASDHSVGEELTLSPKVDLISFTGSTAVGKRIMEKGAATMKRLFLELGGKSATIVLEDADFSVACMLGITPCVHAGQGCAIPTRLLLPRSRYDEGVAILKGMYEGMAAGDPQDPGTLCGPLISDKQRDARPWLHPEGYRRGCHAPRRRHRRTRRTRQGLLGQADLVRRRRQRDDDRTGRDLRPGPRRHSVRRTRRMPSASPTTASTGWPATSCRVRWNTALAVARRLRAGFIGLNGATGYGADVPFGGYKASGVGRQNGRAGFDQYTEIKSVAYPVA